MAVSRGALPSCLRDSKNMNGLIVLDKPAGMTSHDVVSVVRRATSERSVGHLGTLDPMATGVLPLLLGRYTRLAQFFAAAEKRYTGTIKFGWSTDTFDAEGEPTSAPLELDRSLNELRTLAQRFHGELDQVPPVFSAKKIHGVPAYKLARAGKEAPVKPARITVHRFELTELKDDVACFEMNVSSGGYVRSVAQELGQAAGCGAHLSSLRRIAAGPFTLQEALSLDELKRLTPEKIEGCLVHPRLLLPAMPSVTLDEFAAGRIRNGMQTNVPEFTRAPLLKLFTGERELLGIARRVAGTLVQPTVVLG